MNNTTKQRYISTSIWADDWFDSLTEREKLVYFYLLTNEHTNAAGVYQCTLKNIRLEMGLQREDIESIMDKFAEAGKAFYFKEYIIIPKWLKHQKINDRSGLFLGTVKVLNSLPQEIKDFISDRRHYDYDISKLLTPTIDPPKTLPLKNIDPPLKTGRPSQDPLINKGINTQEDPPKTTPETIHEFDLDLDLDSDLDIDSDVVVTGETLPSVENSPTTTNPEHIKEIAKSQGFFITSKQAKEFLRLDNTWLIGDHNFIIFAASRIQEDTSKTHGDHERIFSKAWNYQNLIQEYPNWLKKSKAEAKIKRKKQQEAEAEEERQRKLKIAFNNKPQVCSHCGTPISITGNREICASCGWYCTFDDEKMIWEFSEHRSISEEFKNMLRDKHGNVSELPEVDNFDF